jgi:hypothetical protein
VLCGGAEFICHKIGLDRYQKTYSSAYFKNINLFKWQNAPNKNVGAKDLLPKKATRFYMLSRFFSHHCLFYEKTNFPSKDHSRLLT